VPLLLHIAEQDHLCPPAAQAAIEQAAAASGKSITVMRHPEVGHAFARRASPGYVPAAAERADAATHLLLSANMAGRA
jgi:carboxymethylenebutenolidase